MKQRLYANRPNKTAAGMMKTKDRSKPQAMEKRINPSNPFYPYKDEHDSDVGKLLVNGTCDKLASVFKRGFLVTKKGGSNCPCCGQVSLKYRLTDKGRKKLEIMKKHVDKRFTF